MTVLVVVIALVVIVIGYFISTQRSLVNLDELCKNALSQIEVQLNSRFDAVIALAKTAAKYAEHESDTIIKTIQARGGNSGGTIPANGTSAAAINQQAGHAAHLAVLSHDLAKDRAADVAASVDNDHIAWLRHVHGFVKHQVVALSDLDGECYPKQRNVVKRADLRTYGSRAVHAVVDVRYGQTAELLDQLL